MEFRGIEQEKIPRNHAELGESKSLPFIIPTSAELQKGTSVNTLLTDPCPWLTGGTVSFKRSPLRGSLNYTKPQPQIHNLRHLLSHSFFA
jgi:hypothetical protein